MITTSSGPVLTRCITSGHNDGTHRLYKAHATGAAGLPAFVLTEAETSAIRAAR